MAYNDIHIHFADPDEVRRIVRYEAERWGSLLERFAAEVGTGEPEISWATDTEVREASARSRHRWAGLMRLLAKR